MFWTAGPHDLIVGTSCMTACQYKETVCMRLLDVAMYKCCHVAATSLL